MLIIVCAVCLTAGATTGNRHNIAYAEKTIAVNGIPGGGSGTNQLIQTNVNYFYEQAMRWAQTDAPARLTCDSFSASDATSRSNTAPTNAIDAT